jgi:DNA-binding transcriptional ArsR family regulator
MEEQTRSYRQTAQLFRLLSHPARLCILDALRRRDEACVCHLQAVLRQRQPYVSQQLGILRDAGLVDSRRDGLYIYYRLNDPHVVQALDAMLGPAGHPRHHPDCTCPECQGCQNTNLPCDKEREAT